MLSESFNSYSLTLILHLCAVALSLTLFGLRLVCQFTGVPWRKHWPILRWLPHANDTLLLGAGIALCVIAGWRPWAHDWLALKLLLLVLYVSCGKLALADPATRQSQYAAACAVLCVLAMLTLALVKPF